MAMRFATLLFLSSTFSFAGSWAGALVDSKCYAAEERNVNPTDTLTSVDRDRNSEIRYCSPRTKTKSFAIVLPEGTALKLDAAGDAKAAELVRATGKKSLFNVAVTGERDKNTIKVDSISHTQ
jgi:hypothetical protein